MIRAECVGSARPCPRTGCRWHLHREWPGAPETCALDVADRGGTNPEELARLLGTTADDVRRTEREALARLRK